MSTPLVSVLMLTYNHERYLEKALDSVLSQQTSFEYEIVIGDDVSTDNTRDILKKFQRKYPKHIRLFLHTKNIKPTKNYLFVLKHCKGKYIAILEGDDYWSSPLKLQKQVAFLESHPNYSSCFHATQMITAQGSEVLQLPLEKFRKPFSTLEDLIENESFMASCSTMYRRGLFGRYPQWFGKLTYIADLPINILNAQKGPIGYIDEEMSVYRTASSEHAFSAQSTILTHLEGIKMFLGIDMHFNGAYRNVLQDKIARNCFYVARAFAQKGKYQLAHRFFHYYKTFKKTNNYVGFIEKTLFSLKMYTVRNIATRKRI